MPKGSKYITIEGQFQSDVLGTFKIIRGFADLKELAKISVPYEMAYDPTTGQVTGHQRQIDEEHARRIKEYLEDADNRFIPEVVLSVRTQINEERDGGILLGVNSPFEDGIYIERKWKSKNIRVHSVSIERSKLAEVIENKRIRRIDGNHRLKLAEELLDDPHSPHKYLAPFCLILFNPPGDTADDYAESLIFHTINSTALPLESEHALGLILGQDPAYRMSPEKEFAYSQELYFTRLLRDASQGLPTPMKERIGQRPLSVLFDAARCIVEMKPELISNKEALEAYSSELHNGLCDIVTRLHVYHPGLCKGDYFIELVARVWNDVSGSDHNQKVNEAVSTLEKFGNWINKIGISNLKTGVSLSEQLLNFYKAVRDNIPRKVFLARWYPVATDGDHLTRADLRLEQTKETLRQVNQESGMTLELIDMGTQTGGTYPIHSVMYHNIASSDIILIDLTGVRPNVCVEAGYALKHHERNRLIFIHQTGHDLPGVPFDLSTFRYEQLNEAAELPNKLKPHIVEILRSASEGI